MLLSVCLALLLVIGGAENETTRLELVSKKTMDCSVFGHGMNLKCRRGNVFWFKSAPDGSPPTFIFNQTTEEKAECKREPQQKCVFRTSRNVTVNNSDPDFCAVLSCGHILVGNFSKAMNESSPQDLVIPGVLGGGLLICVGVIAALLYIIMKLKRDLLAATSFRNPTAGDRNGPQSGFAAMEENGDVLTYATPSTTSRRTAGKPPVSQLESVIYSNVRVGEPRICFEDH
ncbi:uncharacterized protein LOC128767637 [Synchiropus splendidus]|uniref:uncharacterized protein LOC128767637 n=1 Tax=Synchiropus splendidus TaxID=270530 RepID=UPI00237E2A8A|nr:uncharacterized protein LOC128767637 [Synchiropus splendidus]